MKRILSLLLCAAAMVASLGVMPASAVDTNVTLRVGLTISGQSSFADPKLENAEGATGYTIGTMNGTSFSGSKSISNTQLTIRLVEDAFQVSDTATGTVLYTSAAGADHLAIRPNSDLTWFKGYTYRGGFEYVRRDGGELTVINVVDIEDYVKGVLPYEMNDSWPLEALKAQAMCARTYAASHFNSLPGYQADVTNDTFSQVYRGTNASGAGTDAAVEATAGLYICYDGELIEAMYCSSNGGATENSENVMYSAVPYLRGRADPYEAAAADINPYSSWSKTVSGSQLASGAVRYGHSLSTVASLETELSESGNVIGLTLTDPNGRSAHISGNECYEFCTSVLGLNSIHFEVEQSGTSFVFSGSGWGHSLGMSQYGAYAMAEAYGFSYDQIINFYFAGVELRRGA